MNVLSKIIIPQTKITIIYIGNELEELAREEFFRRKKILKNKKKTHPENDSNLPEVPDMKNVSTKEESKCFEKDFTCSIYSTLLERKAKTALDPQIKEIEEYRMFAENIFQTSKSMHYEGIITINVMNL